MKNTTSVIFRQSLVVMLLAFVACAIAPVQAQVGQASLTGTVEDGSGAMVA
jgi:hypothetical protein